MTAPDCPICERNRDPSPAAGRILWQDERWLIRHNRAPFGVAGWCILYAKRHVAGVAHFDDAEARSLGPVLRWFESAQERGTDALRIYTAAMGEGAPHFHAHLVPRYASTPDGASGWALFDLLRRAGVGDIAVSADEVARVCDLIAAELTVDLDLDLGPS